MPLIRILGVKQKIGRAALDLFAVRGIDGVTIAEIAATAAGVSPVALYHHYTGKYDLASSLFGAAAGAAVGALGVYQSQPSPVTK